MLFHMEFRLQIYNPYEYSREVYDWKFHMNEPPGPLYMTKSCEISFARLLISRLRNCQ